VKEKKLLRNIFVTVFLILLLTNIVFLFIAFELSGSLILESVLAFMFALLETTIIVVLVTYYNDIIKILNKDSGQMIRLENLDHPLLLKLSNQAPGTYNHSLNVEQLAIKAAQSIGQDTSYLRVGAYFHDIGKLKNPKIYIENQGHETNIDPQDLEKVARAIIDHVVYGQKLARASHLPDEVIEYIGQHHGSSEIYLLRDKLEKANLNAQYPGPKPLSKNAAILMLADSIEARVRGIKTISDESIDRSIENEFAKKIDEEQLDLSGLSETELKRIKESFKKTMQAIYHKRKVNK